MQPVKQQVPSLLPTDIADFTGRAEQIGQIHRHLIPAAGEKTGWRCPSW